MVPAGWRRCWPAYFEKSTILFHPDHLSEKDGKASIETTWACCPLSGGPSRSPDDRGAAGRAHSDRRDIYRIGGIAEVPVVRTAEARGKLRERLPMRPATTIRPAPPPRHRGRDLVCQTETAGAFAPAAPSRAIRG